MISASAIAADAIWVIAVASPPGSHQPSLSGHQPGAGGDQIHSTPARASTITPTTDITIRGTVSTLSAAPLRARYLTGASRRSAQSYCWDSTASPPNSISSPGPGSTSAARPPTTSTQPTTSRATRFAAAFMDRGSQTGASPKPNTPDQLGSAPPYCST